MAATTAWYRTPTPTPHGGSGPPELLARYHALTQGDRFSWKTRHRKVRLLGSGGQGVVFLGERHGADDFSLPLALKIFSPEPYRDGHQRAKRSNPSSRDTCGR